jgi:hypothetical protein
MTQEAREPFDGRLLIAAGAGEGGLTAGLLIKGRSDEGGRRVELVAVGPATNSLIYSRGRVGGV